MSKTRGVTLIGFLLVLIIVGFFTYAAMRLIPIYTEYMSVVSAMKKVASQPGAAEMTPFDVRSALAKHFDVSYVESVKPTDIRVNRDRNPSINVRYEVRRQFIANIDIVVSFDHSELMVRGAGR